MMVKPAVMVQLAAVALARRDVWSLGLLKMAGFYWKNDQQIRFWDSPCSGNTIFLGFRWESMVKHEK
jgi:hypothetical protein